MPTTCAIINCYSRGGRDKKHFYCIPKVICGQGKAAEQKSERRRRAWIAAINRANVRSYEPLRVCSDHFISGKPHPYDESHPDWAPNKHLGYDGNESPTKAPARHARLQNRKNGPKKKEAALGLFELQKGKEATQKTEAALSLLELATHLEGESDAQVPETPTVEEELMVTEELELANQEIIALKQENKQLIEQNECLNIIQKMKANSPEDFKDDNDKVKYYTGLPRFVTLMALYTLLAPEMGENQTSSLSKFQRLSLTLMKLRLNLSITDLSYCFGVCKTTISNAFVDTLNVMYVALQPLICWPDRDELRETMPMVFRKHFGRRVTCIIDCFEIFTECPSNLTARAQTWSNYKHHNTAKYLIGITPQGSVCFISEGWGGRVSDKQLTANCKFLDNLMNGDLILADRGFDIQEMIVLVGTQVKFPSFMRGKKQLNATEVESTRKIADVKIHVERVIEAVRQKYIILGATVPIDYLMSKCDNRCTFLDKIVFVCCALTNMCPSVVPFD
ncbi:uncharacterized protein LOC144033224 [Festucalex cinctus]